MPIRAAFLLLLTASLGRAEEEAPPAPFEITGFSSGAPDRLRPDRVGEPYFMVQFRIRDESMPELDRAVVYLFDEKDKLIHTLTDIGKHAVNRTADQKRGSLAISFPNQITSTEGLKKGVVYTLVFRHLLPEPGEDEVRSTATNLKWKTAVAVIGAEGQYVYRILPAWKRVEELEFKERKKGTENR